MEVNQIIEALMSLKVMLFAQVKNENSKRTFSLSLKLKLPQIMQRCVHKRLLHMHKDSGQVS